MIHTVVEVGREAVAKLKASKPETRYGDTYAGIYVESNYEDADGSVTMTGTYTGYPTFTACTFAIIPAITGEDKSTSDSLGISETLTKTEVGYPQTSDSLAISEVLTKVEVEYKTVSDTMGISEELTKYPVGGGYVEIHDEMKMVDVSYVESLQGSLQLDSVDIPRGVRVQAQDSSNVAKVTMPNSVTRKKLIGQSGWVWTIEGSTFDVSEVNWIPYPHHKETI
jgi:hypothetical protein